MAGAGMRQFAGPGQVSGTNPGGLVTTGIYRISRNPQYIGYLLALSGLTLARRSKDAAALTLAVAAVYRWWIPIEERHWSNTSVPGTARTAPIPAAGWADHGDKPRRAVSAPVCR